MKMKAEIRIMLALAKKARSPWKLQEAIMDSPQSLQKESVARPTPPFWVLASQRVRGLIYVILSYQVCRALLAQP